MATQFFIERPHDEYGNVGYSFASDEAPNTYNAVVIELPLDDNGTIHVIAPQAMADKWPTVYCAYFWECDGPARFISFAEHKQLTDAIRTKLIAARASGVSTPAE